MCIRDRKSIRSSRNRPSPSSYSYLFRPPLGISTITKICSTSISPSPILSLPARLPPRGSARIFLMSTFSPLTFLSDHTHRREDRSSCRVITLFFYPEVRGRHASHLSLIHISEPTRLRRISYAVF